MRLPADQRRQQLLDVACDLFARTGFHDTSMDDIAEAAGVTKPVLYQHFPSKRALYVELLEDTGRRLLDRLAEATSRATSGRERVEAGFRAYFQFAVGDRSSFRLLFGASIRSDPEFARTVDGDPRRPRPTRSRRSSTSRPPTSSAACSRTRSSAWPSRSGAARSPSPAARSTATSSRRGSPSSRGSACAACAPTSRSRRPAR